MLNITNGFTNLTVTRGAYNSMYAPQGWTIAECDKIGQKTDDFGSDANSSEVMSQKGDNAATGQILEPKTDNAATPDNADNDSEVFDDDDDIDLSEIPLSEMSVPQLKAYASQLGIEANTDSARQLRTQIKKVLEG